MEEGRPRPPRRTHGPATKVTGPTRRCVGRTHVFEDYGEIEKKTNYMVKLSNKILVVIKKQKYIISNIKNNKLNTMKITSFINDGNWAISSGGN